MYFAKWSQLFKEYAKLHNIRMKKGLFHEEKKPVSMLDL